MSILATIPLPTEPAAGRLPDAVRRVEGGDGRVVLTRDGTPVAALVPMADLRALEDADDAEDAYWSRVADEAVARWGRKAGSPAFSMKNCSPATG
jgi:prevent-host-death family protein